MLITINDAALEKILDLVKKPESNNEVEESDKNENSAEILETNACEFGTSNRQNVEA